MHHEDDGKMMRQKFPRGIWSPHIALFPLTAGRRIRAETLGQCDQLLRIFQSIYKPLRDAGQSHLRSHQGARQYRTCLVLPATIDGMEYSGLEILREFRRKVVGRGQLELHGAGHAIDNRHLPRWLNDEAAILHCLRDEGRRQQCIG